MPLLISRQDGETWRDVVVRYSAPHGLQSECLDLFDNDPDRESDPAQAAFDALYEWDCTGFEA